MRGVAPPSQSFWDNIWDKAMVSGKGTGTPPALTPRNHSSARDRTRTCTSKGHWNLNPARLPIPPPSLAL